MGYLLENLRELYKNSAEELLKWFSLIDKSVDS